MRVQHYQLTKNFWFDLFSGDYLEMKQLKI